MIQLSHLFMTIGKTIDSTMWIFVGTLMGKPINVMKCEKAFIQRSELTHHERSHNSEKPCER